MGKGKILITGVTGLLGRHVAEKAIKKGYEVSGLSRRNINIKGMRTILGDMTDITSVSKAVSGMDYIVHLAAITEEAQFKKDPTQGYKTNVDGFVNLMEAAARARCKRIICASSSIIYPANTKFSEDDAIDFNLIKNNYARSKIMNEMIAGSFNDIYKCDVMCLRYFNMWGLDELKIDGRTNMSVAAQCVKAKKEGKPFVIFGDGTQSKDFIHADDAAEITLTLLENGKHPVYNVGTGTATSYNQVVEMVGCKKEYLPSPLKNAQTFTRADTKRLLSVIGNYKFIGIKDALTKQ